MEYAVFEDAEEEVNVQGVVPGLVWLAGGGHGVLCEAGCSSLSGRGVWAASCILDFSSSITERHK